MRREFRVDMLLVIIMLLLIVMAVALAADASLRSGV